MVSWARGCDDVDLEARLEAGLPLRRPIRLEPVSGAKLAFCQRFGTVTFSPHNTPRLNTINTTPQIHDGVGRRGFVGGDKGKGETGLGIQRTRDSLEAVINTPSILDEVQNRTAVSGRRSPRDTLLLKS